MIYTHDDKPFIFSHYGCPTRGDVFIGSAGNIVKRSSSGTSCYTRAILKPREVFHTFGGVVFKEGEMEASKAGKWYLFDGGARLGIGTERMSRHLIVVRLV